MPINCVWISLMEVKPLPSCAYTDIGQAYVNGLVYAGSTEVAKDRFRDSLFAIGFDLIFIENIEKLSTRILRGKVKRRLVKLAEIATETKEAQFGTFHCWEHDD